MFLYCFISKVLFVFLSTLFYCLSEICLRYKVKFKNSTIALICQSLTVVHCSFFYCKSHIMYLGVWVWLSTLIYWLICLGFGSRNKHDQTQPLM